MLSKSNIVVVHIRGTATSRYFSSFDSITVNVHLFLRMCVSECDEGQRTMSVPLEVEHLSESER